MIQKTKHRTEKRENGKFKGRLHFIAIKFTKTHRTEIEKTYFVVFLFIINIWRPTSVFLSEPVSVIFSTYMQEPVDVRFLHNCLDHRQLYHISG